jgi:hypothetical protein
MSVSVTFGESKTNVVQAALYKVEEETADRLVLRAKKIGAYLGGGVLSVMGLALAGAAAAIADHTGVRIGLGIFGLLLLAGAVALVRAGMKNEDRIVFDGRGKSLRFDMTREKDRYAIPFAEIAKVELRKKDKSTASERCLVFPVVVVKRNGDEVKVDEGSKVADMMELAMKAASRCGVPFEAAPNI